MSAVTLLNKKYNVDVDLFAEIGHNWGARERGHNLGSWLDSRKKIKFKSTHNTENPIITMYQPGGTCIIIKGIPNTTIKARRTRHSTFGKVLLVHVMGNRFSQVQSGYRVHHMQ